MSDEAVSDGSGEGIGLVVRIVGATAVAAIAGVRAYAFIHDFSKELGDPRALLITGAAVVVLVGAIWFLAETLREAE